MSLLESLRVSLKPSGTLVLAVVLPWCPHVEKGTEKVPPTETLSMGDATCRGKATFEASLEALVQKVLVPCGFEVVSVSRVPYLSQGDQVQRYYVLSDSIIVCKLK